MLCQVNNCTRRAYYGYRIKEPMFCGTHSLFDMFNVVNRICKHIGCTTLASFAYFDKTPVIFCSEHKLVGMINIRSHACEYIGCTNRSAFGYIGEKPIFCKKHKTKNMISRYIRLCKHNGCTKKAIYCQVWEHIRSHCAEHKSTCMVNPTRSKF